MYIYICIYIYIYVHIQIFKNKTYEHHICLLGCVLARFPEIIYLHTYIHTYIHTYMHACMHTCIHNAYETMCINVCIHTLHTYTHTIQYHCAETSPPSRDWRAAYVTDRSSVFEEINSSSLSVVVIHTQCFSRVFNREASAD
jgi:hypothetical protein